MSDPRVNAHATLLRLEQELRTVELTQAPFSRLDAAVMLSEARAARWVLTALDRPPRARTPRATLADTARLAVRAVSRKRESFSAVASELSPAAELELSTDIAAAELLVQQAAEHETALGRIRKMDAGECAGQAAMTSYRLMHLLNTEPDSTRVAALEEELALCAERSLSAASPRPAVTARAAAPAAGVLQAGAPRLIGRMAQALGRLVR